MKSLFPVVGKELKHLRQAMTRGGLKVLGSELLRRPDSMLTTLRRFKRLHKAGNILTDGAKIMQFGADGNNTCVKVAVYVPHWPSTAAEMRTRKALRSNTMWPEQVTLSITDRCPYKCRHCSNARGPSKPMPQSRLVEVVREIQDIGGSWLNVGGGEPGVVFERALAAVAAADGRSETWLNTTGFDLDDDKARCLKEAGLFGGRISIHSHKAAEHDAFVRYCGAFKIAAEAIRTFRRADIFPVLSAAMPEERITWDGVYNMMQLAKDLGAGFVEIIPIRPAGRAVVACSHSELRRHDVNRRMFKTFNTDPCFADYPAVNSPAYLETPDRFGCVAGSERLYISASGDVQPCPLVNLSLGNVLDESLTSICRRMRALLPRPRCDLLCSQLGPLVSEHIAEGGQGCAVLPIPPEKSAEILADLPPSQTPNAWVL